MSDLIAQTNQLTRHVRALLAQSHVQIIIAAFVAIVLGSAWLAPATTISATDWTLLVAIAMLAIASVLIFAAASATDIDTLTHRTGLVIAGIAVAISLALCFAFSAATALIFSIGLSLITLIVTKFSDGRSPWAAIGAVLVIVPGWVWSALDAWSWGLLLLIPLALIGAISDGHRRAASVTSPAVTSSLTRRGHHLAGWLGVLGSAALIAVFGIPGANTSAIILLGIVGALLLAALETVPNTLRTQSLPIPLLDIAIIWIAFCWIVSLS